MHTHYTLEPASNPPKESGFYSVFPQDPESPIGPGFAFYEAPVKRWRLIHPAGGDTNRIFYWLRPIPDEERAKEMGEFAAWCSMNKWVFFPIENEWKKIFMLRTFWKTQDELFALFTQEREKQKQQKGDGQ